MTTLKFIEYTDTLGKKVKIPYRVKYLALKEWQKETGKTLANLDEIDSNLEILEPLFWHSVVSGYKIQGKENPYKRADIEEIIDECYLEFVKGVPSFFQ